MSDGPELVTLAEWAESHGLVVGTVWNHLVGQPGFPTPVSRRSRRDASGAVIGGRGTDLYKKDALDAWRAEHQPARASIVYDGQYHDRGTLGAIASRCTTADGQRVKRETIYQYRDRPTFPKPDEKGRYVAGAVVAWLNERPGQGNRTRGARQGSARD